MKQLTWSRMTATVLATAVLVVGFVLLAPTSLGGTATWVSTTGNSMEPRISDGDLVIVRASNTYAVGEVVAYDSADLHQMVLHRVTSIDDGRYTFRGDHNDFYDPEQPTRQQLLGKELVRIPSGGIWLDRLTHPAVLGVLAFALLAAGGTALDVKRRRRHRRKSRAMSQHAASTRTPRRAAGWAPWLRTTVAIGSIAGAIGLLLGAVSWTRPTTELETATAQSERTMRFSYHAEVPPSPAYDSTRVTSPAPIFRKVTEELDLRYSYRGDPGTVTVAAELSTANGWRSHMPLQKAVSFDDRDYTGTVELDAKRLEARAQAAADAIGIPSDQVDVAVVATITTADGDVFAPRLTFALTPTQLTLVGGNASLTVADTTATDRATRADNTLGIGDYQVSVSALRTASILLALTGLLTLGLLGLVTGRRSTNEAAAIKRRYAPILLHVEPVTSPPGRPVIDVTDFPALARLAERYGLLVMHWTRSDVETYIVHDDGITYRYRTSTNPSPASTSTSTTSAVPTST
ncbi:signal peptidase I [Nocardioides immobilis]|uniref:Signal peptidase I n=1 Tax=Nocardioides immobilis TaxID=2049295 RepID=A0A417XRU6_9ACTN|nr:signal peptidase I [Nocardioides immobilis]RHW22803.1 signal peptidase I [Nocardioides immobilis]